MADMSVNVCGVDFKNPIIPASGVFGYGREYEELFSLDKLGGIATKGTTLHRRTGNLAPRIAETPSGMLNSVGLQNPGIDHFIESELPYLLTKDLVVLANIAGSTPDECAEVAAKLEDTDVHMIELNISCPNVKQGGAAFGTSCEMAAEVTRRVRAAGADAVSLINTLLGMRINIDTGRPILHNNVGGMSGPAVFPIAVRMVWQVANAVNIPVIGMGGVSSGRDAIELMMAGASAVQVGAAIFTDPYAPVRIVDEMNEFLDSKGIASVRDIIGTVKPW